MKKTLVMALFAGVLSFGMAPSDADARRIGGGGSAGMQRSLPARTPDALPAKPAPNAAAPATAGAAPAAAAAKRSWMGPIAGLAAGLGIAALPHTQVRRAGSYPGATTAGVRRP